MPCLHHNSRMKFYRSLKRAVGGLFAVPIALVGCGNAYSATYSAQPGSSALLWLSLAQVFILMVAGYTCLWVCDRLIAQQQRLDALCPGGTAGTAGTEGTNGEGVEYDTRAAKN